MAYGSRIRGSEGKLASCFSMMRCTMTNTTPKRHANRTRNCGPGRWNMGLVKRTADSAELRNQVEHLRKQTARGTGRQVLPSMHSGHRIENASARGTQLFDGR